MISKITGIVSYADPRFFIIETNGIGYKVFTTAGMLEKNLSGEISLWTYLAVRENALDLYGFLSHEELEFFELLISVSGIGPKSALSILNSANPATIRKAAMTEDPSYLTKVSGIGKKTAEKIVLELRNKFNDYDEESAESIPHESDSLEALKALGYDERTAREALKKVPKDITNTSESIKQALKILSKQ